jgi:AraC-like DNA-binding protein
MAEQSNIPPLQGSVITGINLVDCITRPGEMQFEASSLPGHLIHLVTDGRVEQYSSGMRQELSPGCAVWYFDDQPVSGRVLKAPWTFYTVNFIAPSLQPPPYDRRVMRYEAKTLDRMKQLHAMWEAGDEPATTRQLRLHALLLEIILDIMPAPTLDYRMDASAGLWWEIEARLRRDLSRPIDLNTLQRKSGRSIRTIIRACHLSTGRSPMKRVKELRLSYARGLVLFSERTMTEIAFSVGYGRVQEFSRDYRAACGISPTQDRARGPDYREQA